MGFLRGESGEVWAPCLFNDGDLSDQRPKVLKAYLDAAQIESMTYVRWGAAKFVKGQARFAGDNPYEPDAEPSNDEWLLKTGGVSDATMSGCNGGWHIGSL